MDAAGAPAAGLPGQPLWLAAEVQGTVIGIEVLAGEPVRAGQTLLLLESMKMELPLAAPADGRVLAIAAAVGESVEAGAAVIQFVAGLPAEAGAQGQPAEPPNGCVGAPGRDGAAASSAADPGAPVSAPSADARPAVRADLARLMARRALLDDAARPEAVARRHADGLRTARENIADLLDAGSFVEYGGYAVAAQRSRRTLDDLQRQTPADGLITGTGTVDGRPVAVMAYDYTVLAGTQGVMNHAKSDRLLELCQRSLLPLVLWAEGGGGRPGDVDYLGPAGLHCTTFARLAALSGQVPLVGLVAGRCFAGNAALLGCCDLIVAVEGASIGLGGPAMIEGGGLGRHAPEDVGPVAALAPAGVVDVRVPDEAAAVGVARQYLGLVAPAATARGSADSAPAPLPAAVPGADPLTLREVLPANRNALYDPRRIIDTLMDAGSVLELRREFGVGVITALARLGGRAVAVAASQPRHLGGALDAPACDKLARFMQLADAHGLPLVTLVDTPGFMVGPASEKTAMVRHAARLFVNAAALRVPVASVLLRRGYGLGAMALTAGHFHAPVATAAWPGGEFGPMGLEGAVKLGFRKELEAAPPGEREALFRRLLDAAIERGQALNMASFLEVDDVIDPADTRSWLLRVLAAACARPLPPRRPIIDTW